MRVDNDPWGLNMKPRIMIVVAAVFLAAGSAPVLAQENTAAEAQTRESKGGFPKDVPGLEAMAREAIE